jgi:hypothetical protein
MVIRFDVAGLPDVQVSDEVRTTEITSPVLSDDDV